jgi:hypothetical protein
MRQRATGPSGRSPLSAFHICSTSANPYIPKFGACGHDSLVQGGVGNRDRPTLAYDDLLVRTTRSGGCVHAGPAAFRLTAAPSASTRDALVLGELMLD